MVVIEEVMDTIEKLKGRENYSVWKFQMKNLLIHEGLWYAIGGYPDGDTTDEATKVRNDLKALSKINLMLGVSCIPHTMRAQTAVEAWHALENVYEDKGRVHLLQKLLSMKMEDHSSVEDYINQVTWISEQIAETGKPVDEEMVGAVLLKGLSNIEAFEPLIMSVEESGATLTSDLVKRWLMMRYHEEQEQSDNEVAVERRTIIQWFQETSTSIVEKAFMQKKQIGQGASTGNPKKKCWKCHQPGHLQAQCPNTGQPNESEPSTSRRIGRQVVTAFAETVVIRGACAAAGAVGGAVATAATVGAKILKRK